MTPEKRVQNSIMSYLHTLQQQGLPVFAERRQAGGFSYKMGIPDLYAVIDGIHLEIEVKRPDGQLRPMQEKFRDKCKLLHIHWTCVDNIDQFKYYLLSNFNIISSD